MFILGTSLRKYQLKLMSCMFFFLTTNELYVVTVMPSGIDNATYSSFRDGIFPAISLCKKYVWCCILKLNMMYICGFDKNTIIVLAKH